MNKLLLLMVIVVANTFGNRLEYYSAKKSAYIPYNLELVSLLLRRSNMILQ